MPEINVSLGISYFLLSFFIQLEPDPFLYSQGKAPTGFTELQDTSQLNQKNGNTFFCEQELLRHTRIAITEECWCDIQSPAQNL